MTGYFYTITNSFDEQKVYARRDCYYSRPIYERQVFSEKKLENGNTLLTLNVVGINKEDLNIDHEQCKINGYVSILVSGETDGWKVHYPLILQPYKSITSKLENGLLYLEIEWETPTYSGEIKPLN